MLRLLRLAGLVATLAAAAWTTADPDLWGHIRYGQDIVQTRTLPSTDTYSFTSDRPWVNHEWLAEVGSYLAFASGGAVGLVAFKVSVLLAVLVCIIASFRRFAWSPIAHDVLIFVAVTGMLARYHPVRPQLFSLLLFAGLLLALTSWDRGSRRALFAVPPIFALWANLHGGFLVGLGILALWLAVRLLQAPSHWPTLVATGIGAATATLVTPYHFELWAFLSQTVGINRPVIRDWQPLWTVGPLTIIGWLLVSATAVGAVWRTRRRTDPASLVIVALLAVASVRVNRLDAFYTLATVMLLGPAFADFGRVRGPVVRFRPWAWGAAAAIVAIGAVFFVRRASCIEMGTRYPEPQSISFLQNEQGRLLTHFNWGQYAIWHLSPRLLVSMDGRRETVYSDELVDAHFRFYDNAPGAQSLVELIRPDLIWLPRHLTVVPALEAAGWHRVFDGPISTVLAERPRRQAVPRVTPRVEPRCFPDY